MAALVAYSGSRTASLGSITDIRPAEDVLRLLANVALLNNRGIDATGYSRGLRGEAILLEACTRAY